jgi:pyruvyl transferase EpsO
VDHVSAADRQLLATLRKRVIRDVACVVPPGPIALLDFPNYANPGDSAIWLGALACLSAAGLPRPVYTSDHRTFDERMLRRVMPTGTILLMGGGNLGDLWPGAQRLRERVLRAFPDLAIVQLPQTVYFGDQGALSQARDAFAAHPNFTLLVRDARSLEVATVDLGCRATLCPDLALCLTPDIEPALRVPSTANVDTLYLLRTDHEATGLAAPGEHSVVDWVSAPRRARALNRFANRLSVFVETTPQAPRAPSAARRAMRAMLSSCYSSMARERLTRGCRLLASSSVVVTDRLHGHVLSLLLGIPHVVLGDRNGKLRGFVEAWTSTATLARWADTPDDVPRLTRELLERSTAERSRPQSVP